MRRITVLSIIAAALLGVAVLINPAIGVPTVDPQPGGNGAGAGTAGLIGDVVTVNAQLSNTHILQGSDGELYLQLDVTGREQPVRIAPNRLPMNLAIVVDRSGSMSAQNKIGYARQAAEFLVDQLLPTDRVSLVAYDSGVEVLLSSQRVGDGTEVRDAIRRLRAGGNTNLHGGMVRGAAEVKRHWANQQINRVILISDGLANVGPSDTPTLSRIAQQWAGKGVAITAMGVGADFNEDLMLNLSEYSGGNYYFIDEPTKLAKIFEQELTQLVATVAQQATLTVTLADHVQCLDVPGYTFQQAGQTLTVPLGDLAAGKSRQILVRLRVPTDAAGPHNVATAGLSYTNGLDGTASTLAVPMLTVARTESKDVVRDNRELDVLEQNERVQAAEAVEEAVGFYERGDRVQAQSVLRRAASYLRGYNKETFQSEALTDQVAEMEQFADDMDAAPAPASEPGKVLRKRAKIESYEYKK